jgi:hypothetical protein
MGLTRTLQAQNVGLAKENVAQSQIKTATSRRLAGDISSDPFEKIGKMTYGAMVRDTLLSDLSVDATTRRWREGFAQPAMKAWWQYNAPNVREEFAGIPGGFYSADRARGVTDASSKFFGQQIAPTLFSAQESAQNRGVSTSMNLLNWTDPNARAVMGLPGFQADFSTAGRSADESSPWGAVLGMLGGGVLGQIPGVGGKEGFFGLKQKEMLGLGGMIGGMF